MHTSFATHHVHTTPPHRYAPTPHRKDCTCRRCCRSKNGEPRQSWPLFAALRVARLPADCVYVGVGRGDVLSSRASLCHFSNCTHTHTGPCTGTNSTNKLLGAERGIGLGVPFSASCTVLLKAYVRSVNLRTSPSRSLGGRSRFSLKITIPVTHEVFSFSLRCSCLSRGQRREG